VAVIPNFTAESVDAAEVKKADVSERWEELRFQLNDLLNQLYGKLKTLPVPVVVIGMILILIVIGELLGFCFGACWRLIRPKRKLHAQ
jgi:hypothetical protein